VDEVDPPIGRPIANVQIYILDRALQPVPIGVPGEMFIGGDGLARGYLNRPDLTAERFIAHPFSERPDARLYRTGDRARWRSDGLIEFLGRADDQVKIRGFRVEPGEVEVALSRHPNVRRAVVIAREDHAGRKALFAYVVSELDPAPSASELRQHLGQTLPEYMIPSSFSTLSAIPLTPSGKVDRAALPEPCEAVPDESDFIAPRTPFEEVVAGIWAQVLGAERVGVTRGFFELGGHSLRAMQVIARVRDVFGVELSIRAFFETPTVEQMAFILERQLTELPEPSLTQA
jgi:hypothetical protein